MKTLCGDERGKISTARLAFWLTLAVTLGLIIGEATGHAAPSPEAYALLASVLMALAAWAGGPRMAQYLAPQIGVAASAVASAARAVAERRTKGSTQHTGTEPAP